MLGDQLAMVIMMIVVMKVMEVIMMMVMMAGGDPTASLSIKDDWSMLFWCLKAEKGGFTPALYNFRFKHISNLNAFQIKMYNFRFQDFFRKIINGGECSPHAQVDRIFHPLFQ